MSQDNPYSKTLNRITEIGEELEAIEREQAAEVTYMPEGEFNHAAWLQAELTDLSQQRRALEEVVTIDGGITSYD